MRHERMAMCMCMRMCMLMCVGDTAEEDATQGDTDDRMDPATLAAHLLTAEGRQHGEEREDGTRVLTAFIYDLATDEVSMIGVRHVRHVVSYNVMSCHVMSWNVSRHVVSCHVCLHNVM